MPPARGGEGVAEGVDGAVSVAARTGVAVGLLAPLPVVLPLAAPEPDALKSKLGVPGPRVPLPPTLEEVVALGAARVGEERAETELCTVPLGVPLDEILLTASVAVARKKEAEAHAESEATEGEEETEGEGEGAMLRGAEPVALLLPPEAEREGLLLCEREGKAVPVTLALGLRE